MPIRNYEQILRMAGISAWEYDAATGELSWDAAMIDLSGKSFNGTRAAWEHMIHVEDREATFACFREALANGTAFSISYRVHHADTGLIRHISTQGEAVQNSDGRVTQLIGVSWDCTREEQNKLQMRQQQHFNTIMIESLNDPAYVCSEDGQWLMVNEAVCRHFGLQRSEILGRYEQEFLMPEQIEKTKAYRKKFFDQPDGVHESQSQSEHNGKMIEFQNCVRTYYDAVIGKRCLVGVSQNLTRIQQDYQRFKNLGQMIESSAEFHGYFTLSGEPVFINPAGYRHFGINPLTGYRQHMDRKTLTTVFRKALPKVLRGETWTGETTLIHSRTGEKIECVQKIFAICDQTGKPCYIGTNVRDIREEKRRESALVHSSRMASLGAMASGIAHEINNPLTAIMAKAHLVKRMMMGAPGLDPGQWVEEIKHIGRIEELSRRISQIVNSMRQLSRQEASQVIAPIPLRSCFEELKLLCHERMVRHQIDFTLKIDGVESLMGSESQLVQVLINLCNNAVDAIETIPQKWIRIDVVAKNNKCLISVTDCGRGIEPAVVQKIMEPFFTTKAPGAGTGLGLSVSKSLIENMGGRLYYDASSENTRFVIELDSVAADPQRQAS